MSCALWLLTALIASGCAARVEMTPLAPGIWMHTSYANVSGIGRFPSHGLLVRTKEGPFLVDTAWNDDQTRAIDAWSRKHLGAPIALAIVTHAHEDKMGGVGALNRLGVRTFASHATNVDAVKRKLTPAPSELPFTDGIEQLAGGELEAFFPGPGHTVDNLVVYSKSTRVLFGGCLVRPGGSDSLGNVADADVSHWDASVARVIARYPDARIVVPSHGDPGGAELLPHTITLVEKNRDQTQRK
jgi:glyoxylase-like metal-dependent hydrolase (beta-lactamase superfamily II)